MVSFAKNSLQSVRELDFCFHVFRAVEVLTLVVFHLDSLRKGFSCSQARWLLLREPVRDEGAEKGYDCPKSEDS